MKFADVKLPGWIDELRMVEDIKGVHAELYAVFFVDGHILNKTGIRVIDARPNDRQAHPFWEACGWKSTADLRNQVLLRLPILEPNVRNGQRAREMVDWLIKADHNTRVRQLRAVNRVFRQASRIAKGNVTAVVRRYI